MNYELIRKYINFIENVEKKSIKYYDLIWSINCYNIYIINNTKVFFLTYFFSKKVFF
jgi:hypothetical protein